MKSLYQIIRFYGYSYKDMYTCYTESKAMFEAYKSCSYGDEPYYDEFSNELKAEVYAAYLKMVEEDPESEYYNPAEEGIGLSDASEYLEVISPEFPFIILGSTEYVSC